MICISPPTYDPQTAPHLSVLSAQHNHQWSRLWTDGLEADLHALAAELGLSERHATVHHNLTTYLLTPTAAHRAKSCGAIETDYTAWLQQHARSIEEQTLPLFPPT
jgi:hypothetical protein